MIASSTVHPWSNVISGATMYLSGPQATGVNSYDCTHIASHFGGTSDAGRQQNENGFMNVMGSYALEYVLNTNNASSTTWRNKITCLMDKWPALVADQPLADGYNLTVPMNGAFISMAIAYDQIYNDLSAVQVSSYNAMGDAWIAYDRTVPNNWQMSADGAAAVWSIFRDTDPVQVAADTQCYHIDLIGNEQIYPPAICNSRQAYHDLSSEVSLSQLNRDGVSGSGPTYAWARLGGEMREKEAKWLSKDIIIYTGKDTTLTQTPAFSDRPLLNKFYDWLFTFTITPWNTKVVFGDTANNQSSGADNFQGLAALYGHPVYLLSNAWLVAGKYSPAAQGIAQSAAKRISDPVIYPSELIDYLAITSSLTASVLPTKSMVIRNGGAAFWDEDTSSQTLEGVLDNAHLTRSDHYHHYDFNGLFLAAYGVEMLSNPGNGASTSGGVGGFSRLQTQCDARLGNVVLMGGANFANADYGVNYNGSAGISCNSFWSWNPFNTATQNQQYVGNPVNTPLYGGDGILESLVSTKFDYAVGLATGPYVWFDTTTGVTTQYLGQNQRNFLFVHADTATSVNGYWAVDDEVMSASYATVNQIWHPYGVTITTITNSQEYSWDIFPQLQRSTQTLTVFLASPPSSVLFSTSAFADPTSQSVSGSNGNYLQANYLNGSYSVHASSAHILTVLYPSDQSGHNKSTFTRVAAGEAEGATVLSGSTTDYFMASFGTASVTMGGATFTGKIGFMRKNSTTKQFFVRQGTTFNDGASPRYGFDSDVPLSVHLNANQGAITTALTASATVYYSRISGVRLDGASVAGVSATNKFTFSVAPGTHTLSLGSLIVSSTTGNWNDGNTWLGGVVPVDGDTVKIFHTISVTDAETIGTSLSSGTVVIDLQSTGTINITNGGYLKVRGDIQYTHGSGTTNAVLISSGGTLEFDSSLANAPLAQHYGFYSDGATQGYRKFKISGSSSAYASLFTNSQSGQAKLTANGVADSGVYELLYASATNMAFNLAYNNAAGSPVKWDAQHSSFTHCAIINAGAGGNMFAAAVFRHEYNYHQDSQGTSVFNMNFSSHLDDSGSGIRSIKGNIFDIKMTANLGMGDFDIRDNFMNAGYDAGVSSFSIFTNNFIRMNNSNANMGADGTMSDVYTWWDDDQQNPHVYTTTISSGASLTGFVFGMSGRGRATAADDSGEFWLPGGPGRISTTSITNSIFLANGAGYQSLEVTSLLGTASAATYLNNRFILNHNTYFGGWDNSNSALPPFAMLDYSETSNMGPGVIDSFRSNLLWNVMFSTKPAQFFKTLDVGNAGTNLAVGFGTGPTQDVCNPARCDYNGAYVALATATKTNTAAYTNQGNGYAGKFSSTPGVHDVNGQNPNFVDYRRYVEKFDSGYWRPYFGLAQPPAWLSGATYSQGVIVSHSSSTYYWGDSLNYVYIDTGACLGANPEPGVIPVRSWEKCWKFQSIQDIKAAIISSATFTDSSIGATGASVNQTLLKWVRTGYSPLNVAYHNTAHDGGDIGAQPVGTPGNPVITPSSAVVSVGGTIQFASTGAVTWSLQPGSAGSINSNGLYTAPTTYFTPKNISPAGCPLRPNDDVVNTRIDALPVDSSSTARFAHEFTVNGGSNAITFEATMPTNIYNTGTPLQTMNFRYTTRMNGTPFPLLSSSTRMQEASSFSNNPTNDFQDHHILGVDSNTCLASELYGYYPVGANSPAPASNSESGFQYYTNSYFLPDRSGNIAGGTDAAGMAIQPLLLRFSELKSGKITHALRFTLNNANIYTPADNGWDWPATDQAFHNSCTGGSMNCFHYGARVRLKSTYDCTTFTSPGSQAICTALKQYGGFLTDGSSTKWGLSVNYDLAEDTAAFRDVFTNMNSVITTENLEQVNESSLMVSTFSGHVNLANPYVVPDNYAEVLATNAIDGSTSTVRIALQPITAGWGNPAYQGLDSGISVMAGTPIFQIPYWVHGSSDTTASCSMNPSVGTLTSDCKYTAPASQVNQVLVTTITIAPTVASAQSVSFPLVIFSSDGIRMREGPSNSGFDTIPPYTSDGNYVDSFSNTWFQEPANNLANFYTRDTQGSGSWPGLDPQLNNARGYGSGDKIWAAMVPNGSYLLTPTFATSCSGCGEITASTNTLDSQGTVFASSISLVATTLLPKSPLTTVSVTNNQFYWAIRGNNENSHNFLSYWSLLPVAIPRTTETLQGHISMQGKLRLQ